MSNYQIYKCIDNGSNYGSNTPMQAMTINQLRELLDGYCDTCPHMDDPHYCCESGCATPRINADLDALIESKRNDAVKEVNSKIGSIIVPTGLAWKFGKEASE